MRLRASSDRTLAEVSLKRGAFNHARVLDRVERRLRKLPAGARVRVVRAQLAQLRALNRQIDQLCGELAELVAAHRADLLADPGCGALTAAILIGRTARQPAVPLRGRLRAPDRDRAIPCSSGKHPTPAQPRRRPPTQPRATHHRRQPRPTRPGHQAVTSREKKPKARPPSGRMGCWWSGCWTRGRVGGLGRNPGLHLQCRLRGHRSGARRPGPEVTPPCPATVDAPGDS